MMENFCASCTTNTHSKAKKKFNKRIIFSTKEKNRNEPLVGEITRENSRQSE